MASVFSSENHIITSVVTQGSATISDSSMDIQSLFKELDIWLEEMFHFTKEQTVSCQFNNANF